MKLNDNTLKPRFGMKKAIEVMRKSIQETRSDGVISPLVGTVLVLPDGSFKTAFRGELRQGDHAEYTLLERKMADVALDDAMLFATLEPCAPGARKPPKKSCSERILNARIPKVWVGIEDPDPKVDRQGIQFLIDQGVEVEMFDADLQEDIREANKEFIRQAEERAKEVSEVVETPPTSLLKSPVENTSFNSLSFEALKEFSEKTKLDVAPDTPEFKELFLQLGLVSRTNEEYIPTGNGLLLFGKRPQFSFPQALIRTTHRKGEVVIDATTIEGSLPKQAADSLKWFRAQIGKHIDRSDSQRKDVLDYPEVVIREAITNAIVHRDYEIPGSPILFEINDDEIIIKSPGLPVAPLKLEQIQRLNAPALSRNPMIMYVFDQLDLSEQRGYGFETVKTLPTAYKLPLPLITYDAPYLIFTFPRSWETKIDSSQSDTILSRIKDLNEAERIGWDYIRIHDEVSRKEYQEHFSLAERTANRQLSNLVDVGLVEKVGQGAATVYRMLPELSL